MNETHVAFELDYFCLLIRCISRGCVDSKLCAVIILSNYRKIHSIYVFIIFSSEIPDIDFSSENTVETPLESILFE